MSFRCNHSMGFAAKDMYARSELRMKVAGRDRFNATPKEQANLVNLSGKSTSTGRISGESSAEPPKGKLAVCKVTLRYKGQREE